MRLLNNLPFFRFYNSIFQACHWIIITVVVSSCQKVVTIDLNSVNAKLVIEGKINNQPGPYTIRLSHTVNVYDPNVFPAISGASVIISDNNGTVDTLKETSPGYYQTSKLIGVIGRTYTMKISANGKFYTATSTMPPLVPIDSITYSIRNFGNNSSTRVRVYFKDPANVLNYYKFQVKSNDIAGVDTTDVRILADGLADGQELSLTYRTSLTLSDTVFAQLDCIDKSTYNFFHTVPNVEGGIQSFMAAPPANPLTNISNGGLGYFSAYSVSQRDTVIH